MVHKCVYMCVCVCVYQSIMSFDTRWSHDMTTIQIVCQRSDCTTPMWPTIMSSSRFKEPLIREISIDE